MSPTFGLLPRTRPLGLAKIMPLGTEHALNEFVAAVREDISGWCVAAIVSSVLLLLAYSCLPDVRRTPGWQFLYSSICEIYVAVGFLVLSLNEAPPDPASGLPDMEHALCADYRMLVITVLAFDAAANNWRLLMYVDLIVVYHNPFRPNTARPLYHTLVSLTALVWATAISQKGVLCQDDSGSINLSTLTWGLVYAPFLLFVLLGSGLYFAVNALLSRDRSNNPIARLARQRVMLHCLLYLLMCGRSGGNGPPGLACGPAPSVRPVAPRAPATPKPPGVPPGKLRAASRAPPQRAPMMTDVFLVCSRVRQGTACCSACSPRATPTTSSSGAPAPRARASLRT